jgi:fructose/tagatose bisphosphate aldolase
MTLVGLDSCINALAPPGAVGCFSIYNLETLHAVVDAAQAEARPVILALNAIEDPADSGLEILARAALHLAQRAGVPVCVHLNHGRELESIQSALEWGLPAVMYDGSSLPLAENLDRSRTAARMAHASGARIEAELGPIFHASGQWQSRQILDFVRQSDVDFLAFSVPKSLTPEQQEQGLAFLAHVAAQIPVPLVLHGASRLTANGQQRAIQSGVRKVNVHTEILKAMAAGLRQGLNQNLAQGGQDDALAWLRMSRDRVCRLVRERIQFFANP